MKKINVILLFACFKFSVMLDVFDSLISSSDNILDAFVGGSDDIDLCSRKYLGRVSLLPAF